MRLVCLLLLLVSTAASSEEALIAVAANFADVAKELGAGFAATSEHTVTITTGSTGKLYAQVLNGAPFDVLLAADQLRPQRLEESGHGLHGTRFTYATGRLCLWIGDDVADWSDPALIMRRAEFRALAIANPALAPYGAAAKETLQTLGVWDEFSDRIVMGENVGQVYALIATGNAELGFVALSSIKNSRDGEHRSYWQVPAHMHAPIRQDALLLKHGAENSAATAFLDYLRTPAAKQTIVSFGYGLDQGGA